MEWYIKNKEKIKEYNKKWNIKNKEKVKEWHKNYQTLNSKKYREYFKKYYQNNLKELNKRIKNWRTNNQERVKKHKENFKTKNPDYDKKWRKNNPEKTKAIEKKYNDSLKGKLNRRQSCMRRRNYKTVKKGTIGKVINENIFKHGTITCEKCKKKCSNNYHIDHIVPVSKGGENNHDNLQVLCAHCNLSKHVKIKDYRLSSISNQSFLKSPY